MFYCLKTKNTGSTNKSLAYKTYRKLRLKNHPLTLIWIEFASVIEFLISIVLNPLQYDCQSL